MERDNVIKIERVIQNRARITLVGTISAHEIGFALRSIEAMRSSAGAKGDHETVAEAYGLLAELYQTVLKEVSRCLRERGGSAIDRATVIDHANRIADAALELDGDDGDG